MYYVLAILINEMGSADNMQDKGFAFNKLAIKLEAETPVSSTCKRN